MRAANLPTPKGAQGAWIPKRSYNCRRSGSASRSCAWKVALPQRELRVMSVGRWSRWSRSEYELVQLL